MALRSVGKISRIAPGGGSHGPPPGKIRFGCLKSKRERITCTLGWSPEAGAGAAGTVRAGSTSGGVGGVAPGAGGLNGRRGALGTVRKVRRGSFAALAQRCRKFSQA